MGDDVEAGEMNATMSVWDDEPCELGEGPFWHPRRGLFWFDILRGRLFHREGEARREWRFEDCVSAAGWIDDDRLLVAGADALWTLDLAADRRERIAALEADDPRTRSNDGRADPWGGFWIGTMGRKLEPEAGAIYRFHGGALRRLVGGVTVPNAICFAPDRSCAYYADTGLRTVWRQPLDAEGWPEGERAVFRVFDGEGAPDGAEVDAESCLWIAEWGGGRVSRWTPEGRPLGAIETGAPQTTCPAFGGEGLRTLFATTALEGRADPSPREGRVLAAPAPVAGRPAPRVSLG